MEGKKQREIQEQLEIIDKCLSDAEKYVAKNVNVEGSSFLHLDDWRGKSGHPLWMKNFMIPTMLKNRSRKEKALTTIAIKAKEKHLTWRRRHKAHELQNGVPPNLDCFNAQ